MYKCEGFSRVWRSDGCSGLGLKTVTGVMSELYEAKDESWTKKGVYEGKSDEWASPRCRVWESAKTYASRSNGLRCKGVRRRQEMKDWR